jgi:hypothetical protein
VPTSNYFGITPFGYIYCTVMIGISPIAADASPQALNGNSDD